MCLEKQDRRAYGSFTYLSDEEQSTSGGAEKEEMQNMRREVTSDGSPCPRFSSTTYQSFLFHAFLTLGISALPKKLPVPPGTRSSLPFSICSQKSFAIF